jgi:DNA-binding LacI/PurR family transcriptional regulator
VSVDFGLETSACGYNPINHMEAQVKCSPRKRVLNHLREGIATGVYPVGQPLPSERDLAQSVGVARMTVRSVLLSLDEEGVVRSNGGRLRLVSEQTGLNQKIGAPQIFKNTLVLVSVVSMDDLPQIRSPGWSNQVDNGVLKEARKHRLHHLTFEPSRLGDDDWEHVLASHPYGVIITDLLGHGCEGLERAKEWNTRGVPVVAYGDAPEMRSFDRVSSDHEMGGYLLAQAMMEMGRKQILMIAPHDLSIYWFVERYEGYCRALREGGLTPLPPLRLLTWPVARDQNQQFELGYRYIAGHLAPLFATCAIDGIIAVTDGHVPYLNVACRVLGRIPNKDIVIAGYDDFWSESAERDMDKEPPLFSIDKRNSVTGAEMVRLLESRINNELPAAAQKRLIKPMLRRRTR